MFEALREHVIKRLDAAVGNEAAKVLLDAYQTKWDDAVDRGENPISFGLASAVYEFWNCHSSNFIMIYLPSNQEI